MTEKIFSNGTILAGENLEAVEGYLSVKDGLIKEIGEGRPQKRGIDLHRGFIIPTFVNAHTHVGDSIMKDIYTGRRQEEVVGPGGEKFKALNSNSCESKINAIKSSFCDMIKTGTTSYCDFRESGEKGIKLIRKVKEPGINSIILSRPDEGDMIRNILKKSDGIGISSLESMSPSKLRRIASITRKNGKFFSVHAAEVEEAQKSSIYKTGRTEIQRAIEYDPSFLIHGTWASEEDLDLMKKEEVPLVVCSRANHLLSVGTPPLNQAMRKELEIWVGTDNVTVCQPNMFNELSFNWAILRKGNYRVGSEEARKLLESATVKPSRGLNLSYGALEEGNKAVFMVLARKNNLENLDNVYTGIVNRARPDNIKMIIGPDGIIRKFYK